MPSRARWAKACEKFASRPKVRSASAATRSAATKSGRRGKRSTRGPATVTPLPAPSVTAAPRSPERDRSRPSARARSAWFAPTKTSTTPKARKAATPTGSKRTRASAEVQLEARRLGHHAGIPWGVPNDLHLGLLDARERAHFFLDFRGQATRDGAHGRSERHPDLHGVLRAHVHLVDQAELVDVDGDLGVVAGTQDLDDSIPERFMAGHRLDLHRVSSRGAIQSRRDRPAPRARSEAHARRVSRTSRVRDTRALPRTR